MTTPTPEAPTAPPLRLTPEPNSRLEQLHAAYADAKAQADAAVERAKGLADQIKLELSNARGDATKVLMVSPGLPTLQLGLKKGWRLDTKKFKAEQPLTYVLYAVPTETWELRAVSSNEGEDQ